MGNDEFNPGGNLGMRGYAIEGTLKMLNGRYGSN